MDAVRKSLTAGLFFNAAQLTEQLDVNLVNTTDHGAAVYKLVRSSSMCCEVLVSFQSIFVVPCENPHGVNCPTLHTAQPVRLKMHPSSVLWRVRSPCVVFVTAVQGDSDWYEMQDVLAIDPAWLPEVAPHMYSYMHKQPVIL